MTLSPTCIDPLNILSSLLGSLVLFVLFLLFVSLCWSILAVFSSSAMMFAVSSCSSFSFLISLFSSVFVIWYEEPCFFHVFF